MHTKKKTQTSSRSLVKKGKYIETLSGKISEFRERRNMVLDKVILFYRPDNFPQLLKPIRAKTDAKCAITGKVIGVGEYSYPCYENPLRLHPNGPARVIIEEALNKGESILPQGCFHYKMPTSEELYNRKEFQKMQELNRKKLSQEATKLLKDGRL